MVAVNAAVAGMSVIQIGGCDDARAAVLPASKVVDSANVVAVGLIVDGIPAVVGNGCAVDAALSKRDPVVVASFDVKTDLAVCPFSVVKATPVVPTASVARAGCGDIN